MNMFDVQLSTLAEPRTTPHPCFTYRFQFHHPPNNEPLLLLLFAADSRRGNIVSRMD
jgi:hypothetical protein